MNYKIQQNISSILKGAQSAVNNATNSNLVRMYSYLPSKNKSAFGKSAKTH